MVTDYLQKLRRDLAAFGEALSADDALAQIRGSCAKTAAEAAMSKQERRIVRQMMAEKQRLTRRGDE